MLLHNAIRNSETQARPAGLGRDEGLEEPGQQLLRHAGAVVLDGDLGALGAALEREADVTSFRRRVQRVLQQVGDDLREPVRVRVRRQDLGTIDRHRDPELGRGGTEGVDRGPYRLGRVDRSGRERELARVDPGQIEEFREPTTSSRSISAIISLTAHWRLDVA